MEKISHMEYWPEMEVLEESTVMDQVLEDPQLNFREMFIDYSYGKASGKLFGNPIKMSLTPCDTSGAAPEIGKDNISIYGQMLGLKKDDIEKLEKEGVL